MSIIPLVLFEILKRTGIGALVKLGHIAKAVELLAEKPRED
ncbi:MAG: hypothetical protein ABIH23_18410 [bacterium]